MSEHGFAVAVWIFKERALRKRIAAIKIIKKMQIIVTFSICEII